MYTSRYDFCSRAHDTHFDHLLHRIGARVGNTFCSVTLRVRAPQVRSAPNLLGVRRVSDLSVIPALSESTPTRRPTPVPGRRVGVDKFRKPKLSLRKAEPVVHSVCMARLPDLPFGQIPANWHGSLVVEVLDGTRWFIEKGTIQHFRQWIQEVHEANPGDLLPLQWAPMYIGVSRPAIRKRLLAGRLTMFTYSVVETTKTLLGRVENREGRTTFDYLIMSECAAWRDDLLDQIHQEFQADDIERHRAHKLPRAHRRNGKQR